MFYVARRQHPAARATPSIGRPTAACTPRSCSASRGSPAAARCSTTWRRRRGRTGSSRSGAVELEAADDGSTTTSSSKTGGVAPKGDAITGRIPLFFNNDVVMGVVRPGRADARRHASTATAIATRCCSSTRARASAARSSATSRYGPGDYLVLPIGTTWRLDPDAGSDQRMLYLECPSEIEPPKRYRNDYGQLLEHSPYSQRDIHAPEFREPRDERRRLRDPRPRARPASPPTTSGTTRSTSSAGTATCGRSRSTSRTSSRSRAASTSRRRSTRRSRPATSSSARSCPASSTTTRSRSRRPTTTRTSTATRSSTTSPATS